MHYALIDGKYVFTEKSEKNQLNGTDKENSDKNYGNAEIESIPVYQLSDKIHQCDNKADDRQTEAEKCTHSQTDLCIGGKAFHSHIIQSKESDMALSCSSFLLFIRNGASVSGKFGNNA